MEVLGNYDESYMLPIIRDEMDIINNYELYVENETEDFFGCDLERASNIRSTILEEPVSVEMESECFDSSSQMESECFDSSSQMKNNPSVKMTACNTKNEFDIHVIKVATPNPIVVCFAPFSAFRCVKCKDVARYGYIIDKIPTHCHKCKDKYHVIMDGFCKCGNVCTFGPPNNGIRNSCIFCKRGNYTAKPLHYCPCTRIATYKSKPYRDEPEVRACTIHSQSYWIRTVGMTKCECGKTPQYGHIYGFPISCINCKEPDHTIVTRN